ncbi:MAG: hypothetical protein CSA81_12030 [Acidobacteria bacterium]|nr:MAG: hypothetical protein CSA81_12030 [Acidobacteriota bacterium]
MVPPLLQSRNRCFPFMLLKSYTIPYAVKTFIFCQTSTDPRKPTQNSIFQLANNSIIIESVARS